MFEGWTELARQGLDYIQCPPLEVYCTQCDEKVAGVTTLRTLHRGTCSRCTVFSRVHLVVRCCQCNLTIYDAEYVEVCGEDQWKRD